VPTTSIDAFFACTLLVAVALIVTASFASAMQTNIESFQGVNDQNYLKTAAEQIVQTTGSPGYWGSTGTVPDSFGLAKVGGKAFELDGDKICRLSGHCTNALTYKDVSSSSRLYNLAFAISITPMLSITLQPTGNTTNGATTTYNFQVSVTANQNPTAAKIQSYIITQNQVTNVSTALSSLGQANLSFQLPTSDAGSVLLVVFAKADMDERLTGYQTYSFTHPSGEQPQNQQYLSLSPLENKLTVQVNQPDTTVSKVYAFSFGHQSQLTQASGTYAIPKYLDKSPIVLAVTGTSQTVSFVEYTSYPTVPLHFGSEFDNTGQSAFVYTVTVKDVLYKLTVTLGEISK
jgi:hypothetical protein